MDGKLLRNSILTRLLRALIASEQTIILGTAVLLGLLTGLGAVLFIRLIEGIQGLLYETGDTLLAFSGRGLVILLPVIGALISGPIIAYFASEAKGHGVPEVMKAIALQGGRIRPRVAVAKILASALCIGSGGSAGREGPIVQVGATIGSTLGQWFRFSEGRIRNLVACGAASGIAATFNAPIAGVIFATEVILGELHLADVGSIVIASVTSATVARVFLGDSPAFSIPQYSMKSPWEVLLYAALGFLAALTAIGFIKLLYAMEDLFDGWRFPPALKPAAGATLLGLLALVYPVVLNRLGLPASEARSGLPVYQNLPHVYSSGFAVIQAALLGKLSLTLLLALILLKPLATSFTLGSGNSGGVFAPSLFTGAALGGAFGQLIELLLPGMTAGPGAFAVVGMAAVFAGAARAPFTAILIVLEMTNDYRMIVPLMAGVIVSLLLAEYLHRESIYTLKLTRQGIFLKRGRDVDVMESVRVEEVMVRKPDTVPASMPVHRLAEEFIRTGRHGFPVLNPDGSLHGVVSLEDYRRVIEKQGTLPDDLTVGEIDTRDLVSVYPDDTVGTALRRMAPRDLSRLVVVSRENPRQLLGVVRRADIVRAYEVGVVRREEARRRAEVLSGTPDLRVRFIDLPVVSRSGAAGQSVAALALPRSAVLVSIRRGNELIIPHGDTILQEGDTITALCEPSGIEALKKALE